MRFPANITSSCIWVAKVNHRQSAQNALTCIEKKKSNSGGHNNRKFNSVKFLMFPITTNCSAWLVQCLTREKRDNRRHSTTSFCQNVSVAGTRYQK